MTLGVSEQELIDIPAGGLGHPNAPTGKWVVLHQGWCAIVVLSSLYANDREVRRW